MVGVLRGSAWPYESRIGQPTAGQAVREPILDIRAGPLGYRARRLEGSRSGLLTTRPSGYRTVTDSPGRKAMVHGDMCPDVGEPRKALSGRRDAHAGARSHHPTTPAEPAPTRNPKWKSRTDRPSIHARNPSAPGEPSRSLPERLENQRRWIRVEFEHAHRQANTVTPTRRSRNQHHPPGDPLRFSREDHRAPGCSAGVLRLTETSNVKDRSSDLVMRVSAARPGPPLVWYFRLIRIGLFQWVFSIV